MSRPPAGLNSWICFHVRAIASAKTPRSADARVHERCRLLTISKDSFDDLLFMDKELAYEVLWATVRMLAGRLRETTDKLTFLSISGKF